MLLLLVTTLGVQWLLLIIALIGFLSWSLWSRQGFVTLAQRLLAGLAEKIARKTLGEDELRWWRETGKMRRLFSLPALQLTQFAGVAFNIGTLGRDGWLCAVSRSARFGWETTPQETMNQALHRTTQAVAAPWSWLRPEWVPSAEEINASRIVWDKGTPITPRIELARQWYPFFLAALVVWGLLPRLAIWAGLGVRQRYAVTHYSFQERVHREWWRRLTDLAIAVPASGPSDGAIALLWGGVNPNHEELRTSALQQLRVNVSQEAPIGGADVEADDAALNQTGAFVKKKSGARVVILAEAWSLTPKDFQDFHARLRNQIGRDAAVDVFLVGLPANGKIMTSPKDEEVNMWQEFAAGLDDPALFVRPCRASEPVE